MGRMAWDLAALQHCRWAGRAGWEADSYYTVDRRGRLVCFIHAANLSPIVSKRRLLPCMWCGERQRPVKEELVKVETKPRSEKIDDAFHESCKYE
jgi:hypothetical protein